MYTLHTGNSLDILKTIQENSIDSIVTDPPYELGFMGKSWDKTGIANNVELWKECLRVLKPGGHLLAFSGTRTYHRMAVSIEEAGFEVRDMIEWVYGCLSEDTEVLTKDGFKLFHKITQDDMIKVYDTKNDIYKWEKPQRWNQYAVEQDTAYRIKSDTTDQIVSRNHNCLVEREGKLVFVKSEDLLQMERVPVLSGDISILQEGQGKLLHPELLWQGEGLAETILSERTWQEASRNGIERGEEPSLEGWIDLQEKKGKICRPENKVCKMSDGVSDNGEEGWICNGTQIENSTGNTKTTNKNRVCSSYQSRCNGQQDTELNAIHDERGTQEIRTRTTYNTTLATIEKIEYTGTIFCPNVSTGAFIARRNGQVFITGNSGFPKSLNIGKAVDKLQGNEREIIGKDRSGSERSCMAGDFTGGEYDLTKGTSEWEGWGTAMKPSHEPICMARKPLAEKTVAQNVLKYGTGGINIDESRVETNEELNYGTGPKSNVGFKTSPQNNNRPVYDGLGRFPANLIHNNSEEVRECFPETGKSSGVGFKKRNDEEWGMTADIQFPEYNDSGNASRFFKSIIYQGKASKKDRGEYNNHPTVKPIPLMEYLVKMVTKKGGTVLDPFNGSGSTGVACVKNGYNYIGIDLSQDYIQITELRIKSHARA